MRSNLRKYRLGTALLLQLDCKKKSAADGHTSPVCHEPGGSPAAPPACLKQATLSRKSMTQQVPQHPFVDGACLQHRRAGVLRRWRRPTPGVARLVVELGEPFQHRVLTFDPPILWNP